MLLFSAVLNADIFLRVGFPRFWRGTFYSSGCEGEGEIGLRSIKHKISNLPGTHFNVPRDVFPYPLPSPLFEFNTVFQHLHDVKVLKIISQELRNGISPKLNILLEIDIRCSWLGFLVNHQSILLYFNFHIIMKPISQNECIEFNQSSYSITLSHKLIL